MKFAKLLAASIAIAAFSPAAMAGEKSADTHLVMNEAVGVPVFPYDITDHPYVIVKYVKAGVRKATIFSKEPSQEKIYRELWERGEKAGADAIVNATYGDSHMALMSWGKTNALGVAVRFLTDEEIAAGMEGEQAPKATEFTKELFD